MYKLSLITGILHAKFLDNDIFSQIFFVLFSQNPEINMFFKINSVCSIQAGSAPGTPKPGVQRAAYRKAGIPSAKPFFFLKNRKNHSKKKTLGDF